MRIVTTTCSNTEIVCALGAAADLVGVDEHSDFPEDVVARLPRVGPDLGVDPEKVKALRPDLVIASLTVPGHERVVDSLRAAGLDVIAPEPTALADVPRDVRDIARAIGRESEGEALAAELEAAFVAAPEPERRPSVLVEWWPKPVIVPGRDSWVTGLLELAGGRNPLGEDPVKSRPVEDDELRRLDPDAVVISWCGIHPSRYRKSVVEQRAALATGRAVRDGRVFPVPEAHLGRPGPRLVEGLRDLRRVVEACAD